jgi:hypothetical protein
MIILNDSAENATAVYWSAFRSPGAGEYSLCLDCAEDDLVNNNLSVVQWIDGHETSSSSSTPEIIWSTTGLSANVSDSHVLRIRNQLDKRYNSAGQLGLDSLIVTIPYSKSHPCRM